MSVKSEPGVSLIQLPFEWKLLQHLPITLSPNGRSREGMRPQVVSISGDIVGELNG